MVELSQEHLAVIQNILMRNIPDRKVQLFGSRASGKAKPYSDLDLVVMGDSPLPVRIMRQLRDDFDDSPLPFQVDIVDWATTDEAFRKIIQTTAREFPMGPE